MRYLMRSGTIGMVVALALAGGAAWGTEVDGVQAATGTVVAVTPAAKTIVVESTLGREPWIIGAEVTDQTRFEGKARGLDDVAPGGPGHSPVGP